MIPPAFWERVAHCSGIERYFTEPHACWTYGTDNSKQHRLPEGVVFPKTKGAVQTLVHLCQEFQIPLTARGRGTGTPGGAVPLAGGIILSFEAMDAILHFDPANKTMHVQAGVLNGSVQTLAATHGLFWAPDPSSQAYCTVGGNLAYNSAGPRALKYGTPRENTLGLLAIDGRGRLLRTGTNTTKGAVGYDLTRLFIGSEGTLGLIVEATLKLLPLPHSILTLQLSYDSVETATAAVVSLMQEPAIPLALEFIDHKTLQLLQKNTDITLASGTQALLLLELEGSLATPNIPLEGLLGTLKAQTPEERNHCWAIRKAISPLLRDLASHKMNEDVVVPITQIPTLVHFCQTLSQQKDLPILSFGHAGNGNLHVNVLYQGSDAAESKRAQACLEALFDQVLSLGGTLSGEHGIGFLKKPWVPQALQSNALEAMREIKDLFDPQGLLNPGKIL